MENVDKVWAELGLAMNNGPCEVHQAGTSAADPSYLMAEMDAATAGVSAEMRGGMYLLLSLVLELWRRHEYMFAALHDALGDEAFAAADPEYAARIYLHNRGLHSFESAKVGATDWRSRAEMANDIVHSMLRITDEPHARLLKEAVARTDIFAVFSRECSLVPGLKRLIEGSLTLRDDSHGHGGSPGSGTGPQIKKVA